MTAANYLLECREVSRELPAPESKLLLRQVSFGIAKGEVLAILGPSGAGKSTLLRLLNRLDEPTGGTILFDGRNYRELAPRVLRRRVGMIMQRAYLFPGTVGDNVRFGPSQHGLSMADSAVEELLEQVGMAGYSGRDAATLSGGEAQRVAITRALANSPELLLLDEPTSALDQASKESVEELLESITRQRGLACVWVTHDAAQAARMADSVLRLEAGRVVDYGPAGEILRAQQVIQNEKTGENEKAGVADA
jgi:putative ABC transport system ATP-binding protein